MPETDKILSQHEVDALLSAIDSGGGESAPDASAEAYDFRRPSRIPPGPLRFLHTVHEGFARSLQAALSGLLLRPVEARLAGIHQLPLGEFVSSQPQPAVLVLLSAAPLEGNFLLSINPAIAYPLLERLLGAGKVGAAQRDRALSPLEWNVADALTSRILELLAESWAPLAPLRFAVLRRESDAQTLKIESVNEPSVVVALELALGDQRGALEIVFPAMAVEPLFPKMVSEAPFASGKVEGPARAAAMGERLAPAEVTVSAHFPLETARMKDLEALCIGDVLVTHHPQGGPVIVTVEGQPKFLGRLGSLKDRKAARIAVPAGPAAAAPVARTPLTVAKAGGAPAAGLRDALLQLPLTVTAVLAEKTLKLKQVLSLRPGEILEFPRRAEDLLELRVSGRPLAEGSAVRIGERFGLRVASTRDPRAAGPT